MLTTEQEEKIIKIIAYFDKMIEIEEYNNETNALVAGIRSKYEEGKMFGEIDTLNAQRGTVGAILETDIKAIKASIV